MDFRERVSRSIWPSKLGLSGYRILPAKWILSFTEEVSQRCVFLSAGEGFSFVGEVLFSLRSLNAAFVGGGPSVLRKTRKQRSAFSKLPFSAGIWVVEVTSE